MKSVLILFGGNSAEHLVSCMSAKEIRENIDTDRFLVSMAGMSIMMISVFLRRGNG